jgi:hypothetical protein
MKLKFLTIGLVLILSSLSSCTDNIRAKAFGGNMTINVPAGNKVTNITWKEGDLWYSFRPFQEGEVPVTQSFIEESTWGVLEGQVTFIESK